MNREKDQFQQSDSAAPLFKNLGIMILAAGKGKRMNSDLPKVLHPLSGKPMIFYVLESINSLTDEQAVIIVGHKGEMVKKEILKSYNALFAFQNEQLGTGHAVMCGMPIVPESVTDILILCGDTPLVTAKILSRFVHSHFKNGHEISVLAVNIQNPAGYGRILMNENSQVEAIVEEADASEEVKKISIINSGIYLAKKQILISLLKKLQNNNAQKEYYLTDIIQYGKKAKKKVSATIEDDADAFTGVNSKEDLIRAQAILDRRTDTNAFQ